MYILLAILIGISTIFISKQIGAVIDILRELNDNQLKLSKQFQEQNELVSENLDSYLEQEKNLLAVLETIGDYMEIGIEEGDEEDEEGIID